MGELVSIVYKPEKLEPAEGAYTRVPLRQTRLVADYGIEGDAKGGGKRQLNVMSAHVVQDLAAEGFLAEPGQLGEQLIVDGLDVNALPIGTRLRIGAEACVEFTEPRTGCGKFERYQSKSPRDATGRLGMMARVVMGGPISVGDPIEVVASEVVASEVVASEVVASMLAHAAASARHGDGGDDARAVRRVFQGEAAV